MRAYYNEWDNPTAAWLSVLGDGCHLPSGRVDTRSIRDVQPSDLSGYDQCHFFAGIGGWPLALRLAGYRDLRCWTGSPPCQPFSVAGQQRGKDDDRHLAPVWLNLVRECRPPVLFGEQVADAIRHGWLDDLFNALEDCGYACGASVLPACSVGAPHIRKRLFFGAVRVANPTGIRWDRRWAGQTRDEPRPVKRSDGLCDAHGLAHANGDGCSAGREIRPVCPEYDAEHGGAESGVAFSACEQHDGSGSIGARWGAEHSDSGAAFGMAYTSGTGWRQIGCDASSDREAHGERPGNRHGHGGADDFDSGVGRAPRAYPHNSFWSGADWLGCRDGKFRPVEPGTQPLANGLPARVGRLRGYGNAIVPQVAATFIKEFIGAAAEIANANVGGER